MKFSNEQIELLRKNVGERLSKKRYLHTLGVENAACYIASFFEDLDASELAVAALLHDITKEYSEAEHKDVLKSNREAGDEMCGVSAALHSLTAPYVVESDFPEYATSNILSAVRNHTLGCPEMSIFDEIIFISDYVEDGRTYPACVDVREMLYNDLKKAESQAECVIALHRAVVRSLEYTVSALRARGALLHETTEDTLNWFVAKLNYLR